MDEEIYPDLENNKEDIGGNAKVETNENDLSPEIKGMLDNLKGVLVKNSYYKEWDEFVSVDFKNNFSTARKAALREFVSDAIMLGLNDEIMQKAPALIEKLNADGLIIAPNEYSEAYKDYISNIEEHEVFDLNESNIVPQKVEMLSEDENVKELSEMLKDNNLKNDSVAFADLVSMLDTMHAELVESRKQVESLTQEVQALKDDKLTVKFKNFVNESKETALEKINVAEKKIVAAKEYVKDLAKLTVQKAKQFGTMALDGFVRATGMRNFINIYKVSLENDAKRNLLIANKADEFYNTSAVMLDTMKTRLSQVKEVLAGRGAEIDFSESEKYVEKTSKVGELFRNQAYLNTMDAKKCEMQISRLDGLTERASQYHSVEWNTKRANRLEKTQEILNNHAPELGKSYGISEKLEKAKDLIYDRLENETVNHKLFADKYKDNFFNVSNTDKDLIMGVTLDGEGEEYKMSLNDFIHGECDVFAEIFAEQNPDFSTKMITNEDGRMIHAFCTAEVDGKELYADARGITDNWDEFIREYSGTRNELGDGRDLSLPSTDLAQLKEKGCVKEMRKVDIHPLEKGCVKDFMEKYSNNFSKDKVEKLKNSQQEMANNFFKRGKSR